MFAAKPKVIVVIVAPARTAGDAAAARRPAERLDRESVAAFRARAKRFRSFAATVLPATATIH